jgi:dTDP-L-rhamnose 4-epimerase
MLNILLTGGAGFIGKRLALSLRSTGHGVSVFDNLSPLGLFPFGLDG